VEENFDKGETKARECDINSRTPTWISSDTKMERVVMAGCNSLEFKCKFHLVVRYDLI